MGNRLMRRLEPALHSLGLLAAERAGAGAEVMAWYARVLTVSAAILALTPATAPANGASWGSNTAGALCNGHTAAEEPWNAEPAELEGEPKPSALAGGQGFVVWTEAGQAYVCGNGQAKPKKIEVSGGEPIVQVAAGNRFALLLGANGIVHEWRTHEPMREVAGGAGAVNSIAASAESAGAVYGSGHVVLWGNIPGHQACRSLAGEGEYLEMEGETEAQTLALSSAYAWVATKSGTVQYCGGGFLEPLRTAPGLSSIKEVAATLDEVYSVNEAGELFRSAGKAPEHMHTPFGVEDVEGNGYYDIAFVAGGHAYTYGGNVAGMRGIGIPEGEGGESLAGITEVVGLGASVNVVGLGRETMYAGGGAAPAPKVANLTAWNLSGEVRGRNLPLQLPKVHPSGWASPFGAIEASWNTGQLSAPLSLFGAVPVRLGVAEHGAIDGRSAAHGIGLTIDAQGSSTLAVSSISLLGLTVPTRCSSEAGALSLAGEEEISSLEPSMSLTGSAAVGRFRCAGGLLGEAFGSVLSGLFSGPGSATFQIAR